MQKGSNQIRIKPKSIFHLAAYGAYSHQDQMELIKSSILDATVNLINECKKFKFNIFIIYFEE